MNRQTLNPYLPGWEYIPDGEPKLFGDRVYIYGSHDEARGKQYCTGDYVCWSAPKNDLASWAFEGVIFRTVDDPAYSDADDILFFAPDATQGPDGRFYLYYFSSKIDKIGVAVCDSPAGHYRYLGDVHFPDGSILTSDSGFGAVFDPGILSEEGGNWLYYGYGLQSYHAGLPQAMYEGGYVAQLEDDMLTIKDTPRRTIPGKLTEGGSGFDGHAFQEASSIRHYGDLYYLIYSSEHGHDLSYAVSRYPDRDFRFGGVIISNGDVFLHDRTEADAVNYLGNNHGGLLQIDDRFYIFYHRHTHGIQYSRQGCIELVKLLENGCIPQVEVTSQGASGKALSAKNEYSMHHLCYLRSREGILHYSSRVHWHDAHPYIAQEDESGVATLQNQYLFNMRDGAVCGFKYLHFDGSEKQLMLRVRGDFNGTIQMVPDKPDGPELTAVPVQTCEKWHWISCDISPVTGDHAVYFRMNGNGSCDIDAFAFL